MPIENSNSRADTKIMVLFLGFTTLLFALIAAYFAFRFEKKVKEAAEKEKEISRKVFELALLSDITQKIGYSLNITSVAETIALTAENLFDVSTVSYAVPDEDNNLLIKTFRKEDVGLLYTQKVSKIVFDSLIATDSRFANMPLIEQQGLSDIKKDNNIPFDIDFGVSQDVPQSYFNVPLVVDNHVIGMINISSHKKGVYQEADMTLLYKLVNLAETTISKLHNVVETEKNKINSMIFTLPSGAILFSIENGKFRLSMINQSAKSFLKIAEDSPTLTTVIERFGRSLDVASYIKAVIQEKKSVKLLSVKMMDKVFTVYISPFFEYGTEKITGVSVIMRDHTQEEKIEQIRDNFTNILVHDLRAPAVAIKGASNLLMAGNMEEDDKEKMMSIISESSSNMLTKIANILDVGRIEGGKLEINKTKGDFGKFIKAHIDVFSYAARERKIKVDLSMPENMSEFFFDSERIGQVINNLVSNSLKYTNDGGQIDVKISREDAQITVKVSDTGVGIPESKKPFLFTKYGRIRQNIGAGQSSGLGLYISKEIVEAHGGKIWVESPVHDGNGHENLGTAVYFTLPYEEEKVVLVSESAKRFLN